MRPEQIPNAISVARIALVGPTAWLLLNERYGAAFALFLVAGASDALDGQLAKRFGWQTPLGGLLDPIADKLLLVVSFLCLGWLGDLPPWLVGLVILRDLVIVSGATAYHFRVAPSEAEPMPISKENTVLQIVLVLKLAFIITSVTRQTDLAGIFQETAVGEEDLLFVAGIVAAFAILWVYSLMDAFWVALRSECSAGDKSL